MPAPEERLMNFAFTLDVSGVDTAQDDYEDALYERPGAMTR
jgi:hypothetical protein